jgi:glucose-6-phosphate 1-dehydrogenase
MWNRRSTPPLAKHLIHCLCVCVQGDKGLFCSTDELLGLWNIWTPLLEELEADPSLIGTYKQGDATFARSSDAAPSHSEL